MKSTNLLIKNQNKTQTWYQVSIKISKKTREKRSHQTWYRVQLKIINDKIYQEIRSEYGILE